MDTRMTTIAQPVDSGENVAMSYGGGICRALRQFQSNCVENATFKPRVRLRQVLQDRHQGERSDRRCAMFWSCPGMQINVPRVFP